MCLIDIITQRQHDNLFGNCCLAVFSHSIWSGPYRLYNWFIKIFHICWSHVKKKEHLQLETERKKSETNLNKSNFSNFRIINRSFFDVPFVLFALPRRLVSFLSVWIAYFFIWIFLVVLFCIIYSHTYKTHTSSKWVVSRLVFTSHGYHKVLPLCNDSFSLSTT